MGYLSRDEIAKIGFKSFGENLKISDKATFYRPERISLGNNIQIDDFAVLGNHITLKNFIHISLGCKILATEGAEITFEDFSGMAHGAVVFTGSDDYSGNFMTNPTIPSKYTNTTKKAVNIGKHGLIGANAMVMPGCHIAEGVSVGAMSLVMHPTKPWGIYFGNPARRMFERSKNLLELEKQLKEEMSIRGGVNHLKLESNITLRHVNNTSYITKHKENISSLIELAYRHSFNKQCITQELINDKFNSLCNYIENKQCYLLVAESNENVVGICHYFIKDDFEGKRVHLNQIAVAKEFVGKKYIAINGGGGIKCQE